MSNSIKKLQSQVMTNVAEPRNVEAMKNQVGSTYEAIAIIAKRSTQIASQIREELHSKLEEFASSSDNLEEIHENREQIEIPFVGRSTKIFLHVQEFKYFLI